jgi:hypothetical protein
MNKTQRLIAWTTVAALATVLLFAHPLADAAARFTKEVMKGSGALYSTLRVANSVMSVAKDADVSGGVFVASVTGSPGQLLQPVTNTIDRMADLLFCLAIASGILSLVLPQIAKTTAGLLALLAAVRAGLVLLARALPPAAERAMRSMLIICLLGTVVLPVSYALAFYAGNAITDDAWKSADEVFQGMREQYEAAEAEVEQQVDALREAPPPIVEAPSAPPEEQGWMEGLTSAMSGLHSFVVDTLDNASGWANRVTAGLSANARIIPDGVAISEKLFEASIHIAIAYLVKLVVLPLLILAACIYLLRSVFR